MQRLTETRIKILLLLLHAPAREWTSGLDIMKATGIKSGSFYPSMRELRKTKWIEWDWLHADETHPDTPPVVHYRLTPDGVAFACDLDKGKVRGAGWRNYLPDELRWA